ncbi:pyrroline-5-carboxylate reductase [Helicobacter muridarum]|uniref:Pyrroline-5-carboxylate reductase n=1 Tax=Helicobacter muridarum TaxID=216 RepID=A0A099TZ43_9HELI|nr:pyrroline-5-carboxylate reductase dimerization domain-containing protein [Helicobacter muridarum]TLD99619.1 pyrroline-5-carboxylate reductase [Helicobacter muridarum]STQ86769.1 pyrroline-5-carboxylate reductase [Helicobacter muridarum]
MELIIVGYGNMAKAILQGLLRNNEMCSYIKKIYIVGRNPYKIESWLESILAGGKYKLMNGKDIILQKTMQIHCNKKSVLLACKPYNLKNFSFSGNAEVVYSILAGIGLYSLKPIISGSHYVMIMPNICAELGFSSNAVLWYNSSQANSIKKAGETIDALLEENRESLYIDTMQDPKMRDVIENFVSSFGNCVFVQNEQELHASIATNGSSPAVLALVAQALINAGVHSGLGLDTSKKLVQKTFEGLAQLLLTKTPQEIKDSITTPGGTTARALLHCDESAVQGNITRALIKAVERVQK